MRKSNGNLAANGTLYWYMTPGVVAETDLAGTLKSEYAFFDGERVARRDGATGTAGVFYYFSDHLKTASVITDSTGVIKAESAITPGAASFNSSTTIPMTTNSPAKSVTPKPASTTSGRGITRTGWGDSSRLIGVRFQFRFPMLIWKIPRP